MVKVIPTWVLNFTQTKLGYYSLILMIWGSRVKDSKGGDSQHFHGTQGYTICAIQCPSHEIFKCKK
jgi:hypothetical protein